MIPFPIKHRKPRRFPWVVTAKCAVDPTTGLFCEVEMAGNGKWSYLARSSAIAPEPLFKGYGKTESYACKALARKLDEWKATQGAH